MNMYNQYLQGQQQNPYLQQRTTYPVQSNGIIWVQGVEGAKAYQMNPNSILQLMDSENDGIFYIKVSDNIGMTTLRVFRYEEIQSTPKETAPSVDLSAYVRKDELKDLIMNLTKGENVDESAISTAQSGKHKSDAK